MSANDNSVACEFAAAALRASYAIRNPGKRAKAIIAVAPILFMAGDPAAEDVCAAALEAVGDRSIGAIERAKLLTDLSRTLCRVGGGLGDTWASTAAQDAFVAGRYAFDLTQGSSPFAAANRSVESLTDLAQTLVGVAEVLSLTGDPPAAREAFAAAQEAAGSGLVATTEIDYLYTRVQMLGDSVGDALIATNMLDVARLGVIVALPHPKERAEALILLARRMTLGGHSAAAREVAAAARVAAGEIPPRDQIVGQPQAPIEFLFDRANWLAGAGEAFAEAGDASASREAAEAARTAASIPAEHILLNNYGSERQADHEGALRDLIVARIAEALAKAGDERALKYANAIHGQRQRFWQLINCSSYLVDSNPQAAKRAAFDARMVTVEVDDPGQRSLFIPPLATALAKSASPEAAIAACDIDTAPFSRRATALIDVAQLLAHSGRTVAAHEAATAAAVALGARPHLGQTELIRTARLLLALGDGAAARQAVLVARPGIESLYGPERPVEALAEIATILAAVGDAPAARQTAIDAWQLSEACNTRVRDKAFDYAVRALSAVGDVDGALEAAGSITYPEQAAAVLTREARSALSAWGPQLAPMETTGWLDAVDDSRSQDHAQSRGARIIAELTEAVDAHDRAQGVAE